jgi:hypothetical protein
VVLQKKEEAKKMEGFWDLAKDNVLKAYSTQKETPSLTDQLLYAILAQLDKISYQLDETKTRDVD